MLRRPADRRGQAVILVAGATGHVGSQLVRLLAEGGTPARALIHSPDKAAPIQRLGLETALGDFEQTDTLDAAMAGCDHLFLLSPPSPRQPEQEQHVIDAARRAGVAHVVKLSAPGADPHAPVVFGRWHAQIEQYLAQSGLAHTLLRPGYFMQNFLMSAQPVAEQGVLYGMTGEGRVGYIDARDIAAVAARVLTSPGHQGTSYTLTGPESLSAAEVAERLLVLAVASRTSSEGAGLDLSLLCGLFGIRCPHDPVLRRILPQIVTKAQSASKVARPRLVSPTCDRCRSLADAPPQGGHQASAVEAAAGRSRPRSTGVRSCSASTW